MTFEKKGYKKDYKSERYYTPAGKIRYRTVYVGKNYVLAADPAARKKLRVLWAAGTVCAWALLLTTLFSNGILAYLWWVVLPQAAALIPLCFFTGGVWRFVFAKAPLVREDADIISGRTAACAAVTLALTGLSFLSAAVSLVVFRSLLQLPADALFGVFDAALFALLLWLYRRRADLAVKEVKG